MKLFAPKYYERFACIAERCRHSCCIGWEIDVDDSTYKKYASLRGGYGDQIKKSIDTTDTPHFILCDSDRCPHLNEKGLCKIILNLGEDHLCDICREHPRFYNFTSGAKEVGLGIACEEACRIVLSSDGYDELVCLYDDGSDPVDYDFDATCHREEIYRILSDRSRPYTERLEAIGTKHGAELSILDDEQWHDVIKSLEYLDEGHKDLFLRFSASPKRSKETEVILERTMAYFIYRHCTEACDEYELSLSVGLCLFLESLLASLIQGLSELSEICELARTVSEELEYNVDNTDLIKKKFDFYGEQYDI